MRTCRSCPELVWGTRQWCHRCKAARDKSPKGKPARKRSRERDLTPAEVERVFLFHKQVLRERRRRAA